MGVIGDIANAGLGVFQTGIGLFAGGGAKKRGREYVDSGNRKLTNAMASRKDYTSSGELQSMYDMLNTQAGGRSSLTGLLEQNIGRATSNYMDAVRSSSVSGAQLSAGAGKASNMYGKGLIDASIAGYQDTQQKRAQQIGIGGQLESINQYAYENNVLLPYYQAVENAQAEIGYGHNLYNTGVAAQTGTISAGLGALDFGFLDNINWNKKAKE